MPLVTPKNTVLNHNSVSLVPLSGSSCEIQTALALRMVDGSPFIVIYLIRHAAYIQIRDITEHRNRNRIEQVLFIKVFDNIGQTFVF